MIILYLEVLMTTSRDLVRQTLTFASPRRIPRQLWLLPWAETHYTAELHAIQERFPDDFTGSPGFNRLPYQTRGNPYTIGTYVDEWGSTFENIQAGVIGEVKDAFIKTWDDLDRLKGPEAALTIDIDQVNAFCREQDKFVFAGCCPRPFERLQFLRRTDQLMVDIAEGTPELERFIKIVHEFYLRELELWVHTEVDAINFMDDWGAQRALLISPRAWRRYFKPLYKEYIDLAHQHGKYIFMHSDGYTADIIPDLVELGLDAINTQIFTMDIEDLGRRFAGKITFWGEIDRQHLLPFGSTADIANAVGRAFDAFYANGGVIAQCEFGAGAKPENVYQVYQSWEDMLK